MKKTSKIKNVIIIFCVLICISLCGALYLLLKPINTNKNQTTCEHVTETIPAIEATCNETGLTAGEKCSKCGEVLIAQTVIPVLEHIPQTIPAIEATCSETGLTAGEKCSLCGEIFLAQNVTPVLEHDYSVDGECSCGRIVQGTDGLTYTLSSDESYYICSGYTTPMAIDVEIASQYNGLPVREIGMEAFSGCDFIYSVKIPNSVTYIGIAAFSESTLVSVIMADSVTNIDTAAFYKCSMLKEVVFSKNLSRIASNSFWYTGLEYVIIPEGITSFGGVFSHCSELKEIVFPSTFVKDTGGFSFSDCTSLTTVVFQSCATFPEKSDTFLNCTSLEQIIIPDGTLEHFSSELPNFVSILVEASNVA